MVENHLYAYKYNSLMFSLSFINLTEHLCMERYYTVSGRSCNVSTVPSASL